MTTRSQQLRARGRRVFAWSLVGAAAIHVAVFLLAPGFRTELLTSQEIRLDPTGGGQGVPTLVALFFGPPTLTAPDGTTGTEPPRRVLRDERLVVFPPDCAPFTGRGDVTLHGSVHLHVNPSGRTKVVEVARTTGNDCGDAVMTIVADALWYHWLPNDRFPAPVDVIQPITMGEALP